MNNRFTSLDAIRAFAVSLVVLYHLKVPGFSFGYLGVDLFFILSGFLMTYTMLVHRKNDGTFKIWQFFIRRFQRIIPSLLIVIFATLLASFVLMSPDQLVDTLTQGFYAQFFVSNILFFDQAGYFSPENEVRALLHTWSLSVEEQFYLFFALLLAVGNKLNFARLCLVVSALALILLGGAYWVLLEPSLQTEFFKNEWQLDAAIFFLPPFRLVQFMAGVLVGIAIFSKSFEIPNWIRVSGLATPVVGFIILQYVPTAKYWTHLIVIVSFVPLFFNNPVVSNIGKLAPVRFIARISYQVYLTHWPIIVFWRYWTFQQLSVDEMVMICGLSIVTGWLLFNFTQYLKTPKFSKRKLVSTCLGILIFSLGLQSIGYFSNGAEWRIPEYRRLGSPNKLRTLEDAYCGGTHVVAGVELGGRAGEPLVTCTRHTNVHKSIYALGDSHARHLVPGLSEIFPKHIIKVMYFTSCLAQSGVLNWIYEYEGRRALAKACVARNQRMLKAFRKIPPATIIIHQYSGYIGDSSNEWFEASSFLINQLQAAGHKVLWLGSVLRPGILQTDCYSVPKSFSDQRLALRCKGVREIIDSIFQKNNVLMGRFPNEYINVNPFFCTGNEPNSCSTMRNGLPLFRDKHHLTVNGSIALISKFKNEILQQ